MHGRMSHNQGKIKNQGSFLHSSVFLVSCIAPWVYIFPIVSSWTALSFLLFLGYSTYSIAFVPCRHVSLKSLMTSQSVKLGVQWGKGEESNSATAGCKLWCCCYGVNLDLKSNTSKCFYSPPPQYLSLCAELSSVLCLLPLQRPSMSII